MRVSLGPGVRPIGIGEVFRRIVGKAVMMITKHDVQEAAGPLQTCTGLRSGIEASIHFARKVWDEEDTEAIIQVDADNAFNRLNRQVALHNIRELCPSIYRFLFNHYQKPAQLIVNDHVILDKISSEEGPTQGDVAALDNYALGLIPLIKALAKKIADMKCKQSWYADDSTAAGKLAAIKVWWVTLCELGPMYGYYPKASKTVLILKDYANLPYAKLLFSGCGMKITCDGQRHLGAAIGSDAHKSSYVYDVERMMTL